MKLAISITISLLTVSGLWAQVPEPVSPAASSAQPDYIASFTWNKTGDETYQVYDNNGTLLSEIQFLSRLKTDTLSLLHKPSRSILLLPDFDSAANGQKGNGYVLMRNVDKNFYVTNPKSYITYVDDASYTAEVTNVAGSYVAYIDELDKTYLEKDIRAFSSWGAKNLIDMGTAPNNTFWYRDRENQKYGIIIKGESMDYSNVTSEVSGDDRVIYDDGKPVYLLEDYSNIGSFVFKPVSTDVSGFTSETKSTGCVRGDCQNGFGKYQYDNGYYDGFWSSGNKSGYGLYSWDNGGTYVGNWTADQMTGYGVYTADNDDLIKGIFENGQLNGLGVTRTGDKWEQGIFTNGTVTSAQTFYGNDVDTGCTIGDCEDKYGKMVFANGDTYVGFFKGGNLHMGTYSFASGAKYSGQFDSRGSFSGMGRFWFANGDYYGGSWSDGKFDGRGYYSIKESGESQIGQFQKGTFVEN